MKSRPTGITILSILFWVGAAWTAVLASLSLFSRPTLESILHALSPGGAGPAETHVAMGGWLPAYYIVTVALCAAIAVGLWRVQSWARYVVLAMAILSFVGVVGSVTTFTQGASAGAIGLFILRLGLCVLWTWYLLSRGVRAAFSK